MESQGRVAELTEKLERVEQGAAVTTQQLAAQSANHEAVSRSKVTRRAHGKGGVKGN